MLLGEVIMFTARQVEDELDESKQQCGAQTPTSEVLKWLKISDVYMYIHSYTQHIYIYIHDIARVYIYIHTHVFIFCYNYFYF